MWRATLPFDGAIYIFRGRRAGLIKLLWHDGIGLCVSLP
jgi:transposase